jgi:nicotinamide phosphoribosyltransferase
MLVARKYYGEACGGFSIPASEHSTITSWGKDGECDAMKNMLEQYPVGLVACVSDSFDVFKACEEYWGGALKELVQAREGKGFLVIRPDSGPPVETTLKIFEILDARFGMATNTMGYKVLPSYLRMIWGDGIDYESLVAICGALTKAGYSTDNIAFGSGGGLLQKLNRDTQKCAFKCSAVVVGGEPRHVFKDPVTDSGKKSK